MKKILESTEVLYGITKISFEKEAWGEKHEIEGELTVKTKKLHDSNIIIQQKFSFCFAADSKFRDGIPSFGNIVGARISHETSLVFIVADSAGSLVDLFVDPADITVKP